MHSLSAKTGVNEFYGITPDGVQFTSERRLLGAVGLFAWCTFCGGFPRSDRRMHNSHIPIGIFRAFFAKPGHWLRVPLPTWITVRKFADLQRHWLLCTSLMAILSFALDLSGDEYKRAPLTLVTGTDGKK